VLDDADRGAAPDRLDPTGTFRRALRTALVNAVTQPARRPASSCERELVRTAHCASHTDRRASPDSAAD
jgi:hypothetical protein